MTETADQMIIFDDVSKFYGEILGINRVNLQIAPGITSLVGPNGAGKSTLMNLMTGLLQPTRGHITILGTPTDQPEELFRKVGYCTQFDSFPRGLTGREFIKSFLLVHGLEHKRADELTVKALDRKQVRSYLTRHYRSPDMVISAAGAVSHAQIVEEAERLFAPFAGEAAPQPVPAKFVGSKMAMRSLSESAT